MEKKKKDMDMKNPMDKNKLGDPIPRRNQTKGQHPGKKSFKLNKR